MMQLQPGQRVGHCRVLRLSGTGGMSTVYEARDEKLGRAVAVKVLHSNLLGDAVARERFKREALAAAKMDHPHIVRIYDYLESPEFTAIVMEHVPGSDMDSFVRQSGPLPFLHSLWVMHKVALGLAEAHRQGIVHRDVKPSNILLRNDGRVMLTDFGLAHAPEDKQLTMDGTASGTPQFMSPEQMAGKRVGIASDIYSWAITLYFLCAGRVPYRASGLAELAGVIRSGNVEFPESEAHLLPPKGRELLQRCLIPVPDHRIQNGTDLLACIDRGFDLRACDGLVLRPLLAEPLPVRSGDRTRILITPGRKAGLISILVAILVLAGVLLKLRPGQDPVLPVSASQSTGPIIEKTPKPVPSQSVEIPVVKVSAAGKPGARPLPISRTATDSLPNIPVVMDSGQVFIFTEPWARISVDGKPVGTTPMKRPLVLTAGTHLFTLVNDFYVPKEDSITILAGKTARLRYRLEPRSAGNP